MADLNTVLYVMGCRPLPTDQRNARCYAELPRFIFLSHLLNGVRISG